LIIVLAVSGCGSTHGWREPSARERAAITKDIRSAWRVDQDFAHDRALGLRPVVSNVRISRTDRLFASADIEPRNAAGRQLAETATVAIQVAEHWLIVIGPGTDFAFICEAPAPQPIRDLFCR